MLTSPLYSYHRAKNKQDYIRSWQSLPLGKVNDPDSMFNLKKNEAWNSANYIYNPENNPYSDRNKDINEASALAALEAQNNGAKERSQFQINGSNLNGSGVDYANTRNNAYEVAKSKAAFKADNELTYNKGFYDYESANERNAASDFYQAQDRRIARDQFAANLALSRDNLEEQHRANNMNLFGGLLGGAMKGLGAIGAAGLGASGGFSAFSKLFS